MPPKRRIDTAGESGSASSRPPHVPNQHAANTTSRKRSRPAQPQDAPSGTTRPRSGSRPDRAEKKAKRSEQRETVVKAALLRHVEGDADKKAAVRDALMSRVVAFSKRARAASLGLMHLVKQRFAGVQADHIATVQVPQKFFGQTFVRQLMVGTDDALDPDPDVEELHRGFPQYLDHSGRHTGDGNVYTFGANKYLTNVKNHMRVNLDRFMRRTLNALYPHLSGTRRYELVRRIKGGNTDDVDDDDDNDLVDDGDGDVQQGHVHEDGLHMDAIVRVHRAALGLATPQDRVSPGWMQTNACLPRILRYYVFLNRALEEAAAAAPPEQRPRITKRLFNVVPLCQIKTHFITVDTDVLYGLMVDLRYVQSGRPVFRAFKDAHWRSVFRISRLEGRPCQFTGTIETDGTAICVHFVRERNAAESGSSPPSETTFRVQKHDLVVGCDPGGVDIMALAIPRHGNEGAHGDLGMRDMRFKTFSRSRYYREAGFTDARRHTEHWNASIRTELTELCSVSSRGADLAAFRAYVDVHVAHGPRLWEEYTRPRWARQRFRLYGGKKHAFAKFLNELEAIRREASRETGVERRLVVAYGNGRAVATQGCTPAPSTRSFAECSHRFVTVPVDEFRTTYTHCERGCELMRVKKRVRPRSAVEEYDLGPEPASQRLRRSLVRGLLWCGSTSGIAGASSKPAHFVNRDLNAAVNIRQCLLSSRRPAALDRQLFVGHRSRSRVGNTIRR